MGELLGSIAFTLIVIAVIAGTWAWISTLFRRGLMALVGFDRVCVQQFETMLLYKNGRFERALPPGRHRIRAGSRQIARIDRRPEIFRLNQGTVSTDRFALNLTYVVRTQIVDPRATFESTQNYRDEICMRLQSVVKAMCSRKTRLEIQTDHQTFGNNVQKAANQVFRSIGCECLTFELMQVDIVGPAIELDAKRAGVAAQAPVSVGGKSVIAAL
ncbi:MAG TPA: SPFH domain-containing protein [Pseudolabrys sp.]|nr:SPFH domain-containing protein [Pseudolabrys sp.]